MISLTRDREWVILIHGWVNERIGDWVRATNEWPYGNSIVSPNIFTIERLASLLFGIKKILSTNSTLTNNESRKN